MTENPPSQVQQLLEECRAVREQTITELKEVEILFRQSTSEVEKLARRNAEITNRLSQIESNFDTVPRADIQRIYRTHQREQGRLFVIRGQSEMLQGKQDSLIKHKELLDKVMSILEQTEPAAGWMAEGDTEPGSERSMTMRIIEAQESEYRRLARQMHDGPAQLMTNVILQAEICQRLLAIDPERARAELERLKARVNKAFKSTRTFISDLRPMMLDDLGLVPALGGYVDTWSEKTGIKAEFTSVARELRLAPFTEGTIFRVVQVLMSNAARHANPSLVQVTLQVDGQMVRATVEDDGIGFDVDEVLAAANERKTLGISLIMDRVHVLGGTLRFESVPGRGTRAFLEIPET